MVTGREIVNISWLRDVSFQGERALLCRTVRRTYKMSMYACSSATPTPHNAEFLENVREIFSVLTGKYLLKDPGGGGVAPF